MINYNFSVLLSIYQKESANNLEDCFKSIYDNQIMKPDEIVLVEDGPLTKELYKKIEEWKIKLPNILKIVKIEKNRGLAHALNLGIKECSYELVARMDTDDVAYPDRFLHQVDFMIKNPSICVSSGIIEEYDIGLEKKLSQRILPKDHKSIYKFAKRRSPISHPACIYRKKIIIDAGGYPEIYPEDYALWGLLLSKGHTFGNIEKTILKMRASESIAHRRGINFLKGEIKTYLFFHRIGFLNTYETIQCIFLKSVVRLAPNYIKKLLYKFAR